MTDHSHPSAASRQTPNGEAGTEHVLTDAERAEADRFWMDVAERNPDKLNVRAELQDYHFLLDQVPRVYMHVTGGRLSKPNYYAHAVIGVAEEHIQKLCDEAAEESELVLASRSADAVPTPSEAGGREGDAQLVHTAINALRFHTSCPAEDDAHMRQSLDLATALEGVRDRLRASRPSSGEDSARYREDAERWRSLQPSLFWLVTQVTRECTPKGERPVLRDALIGQKSDATFYSRWERVKGALRDFLDAADAARAAEGSDNA